MRTRMKLLALPLALCGIWLVAHGQEPAADSVQAGTQMTRDLARLVTVVELEERHSTRLETNQKFRPVRRTIHEVFVSDADLQVSWTTKVITNLNGPLDSLGEFEKRALDRIKSGEREVWETSQSGARYVRGIRTVGKLCVECHRVVTPIATKEQELLAAISVELRPKAN